MELSHETELLYRALASPLGIVVTAGEVALARQRLYSARRQAGDDALASLQFRVSPQGGGDLWIVRAQAQALPRTPESAGEPTTTLEDLGL